MVWFWFDKLQNDFLSEHYRYKKYFILGCYTNILLYFILFWYFHTSCLDKAAIITSVDSGTPNPWRLCTVTMVEKVKMLVKLLPIWATTIIFWTIHVQLASFYVQQAATMDRSIGKFQIPAASLYAFFVVAMMTTLAIYDNLIMPLMKNSTNSQGT